MRQTIKSIVESLPPASPLLLALILLAFMPMESEAARVCRAKVTLPLPEAGTCDIDTDNPVLGNPFAYIDPTKGCDFTFSLPGLPAFSLDGLQNMLCNQIQDIGQQTINDALGPIMEKIPSSVDIDLNAMLDDMFETQMDMQKDYCPEYDGNGKLTSYKCPRRPGNGEDYIPPEIVDPNKGENCFIDDEGITRCYVDKEEPELPYCDELTDFYDGNGNLVPCIPRLTKPEEEPVVHNSFNSRSEANNTGSSTDSTKPSWNNKSGW